MFHTLQLLLLAFSTFLVDINRQERRLLIFPKASKKHLSSKQK